MQVGKIISKAATLLGKLSLKKEIEDNLAFGKKLSDEAKIEVEKLMPCYNLTMSELSEERCPLVYKENVTPIENRINYSALEKTPIEIKSVYRSVNKVFYQVFPTYIELNSNDEVTVEYVYKHEEAQDLSNDFNVGDKVFTPRVIAEGVTAEYYLISGLYEDALLWRDRYLKSLSQCLMKRRVGKIKPRGWY